MKNPNETQRGRGRGRRGGRGGRGTRGGRGGRGGGFSGRGNYYDDPDFVCRVDTQKVTIAANPKKFVRQMSK